ncbi:MAG: hypothetical protein ACI4AM_05915 [Muribaculaceae bacterium]
MRRIILLIVAVVAVLAASAQTFGTRFVWGAEAGAGIDMSNNDMSSIDFNASFGLSRGWIDMVGVGAGVNMPVSNSCRSYPIFAVLRTDFSPQLRLCFLDVRGGVSLNYLARDQQQTGLYGSINLGVNLATGSKFRSYVLIGYTFIDRKDLWEDDMTFTMYSPLHMATIRLGVSF